MIGGQQEMMGKTAMVRFQDHLWAARKGKDEDLRVFLSFFDGFAWSTSIPIPGVVTACSPALAATETELYLLWWGEKDGIHWAKSLDGHTWSLQKPLFGVGAGEGGTRRANEKPHLVWTTERPLRPEQKRMHPALLPFLLPTKKL